jgi:hypothetical protein
VILKKDQKVALLGWISEGLDSKEINDKAAVFSQPFTVSRQQVDYYRKTRHAKFNKLKEEYENKGLNEGLARVAVRVTKLKELAALLEKDLFNQDLIWLSDKKGVGTGTVAEIYDFEKFNKSEVDAYRDVLNDIAIEVGDRVTKIAPVDPTGTKEYGAGIRDTLRSLLLQETTPEGEGTDPSKAD